MKNAKDIQESAQVVPFPRHLVRLPLNELEDMITAARDVIAHRTELFRSGKKDAAILDMLARRRGRIASLAHRLSKARTEDREAILISQADYITLVGRPQVGN